LNSDGSFSYVPAQDFNGTDSFEYQVSDGNGGFDTATVTITVNPVNDLPVGQADSYDAIAGQAFSSSVSVLDNDTDVDGDALVAILVSGPSNGVLSLSPSGNFIYTPADGFAGTDSFTYVPNDGTGSGSARVVEVQVIGAAPPVDPPDPNTPDPEPEPETNDPDSDPDPETPEEPNEPEDESTDELPELNSQPIRKSVPVVDLTGDDSFGGEGDIEDLFAIMADSDQARAVLKTILSSVSIEDLADGIDSDDIRRLRLRSGLSTAFNPAFLWEQFDEIQEATSSSDFSITVGAITAFGTIGYVFWALRGGALMALALSQLPTWRMIDPLPVLESYSIEENGGSDDMDQFFS
jgi:hypothetical protein